MARQSERISIWATLSSLGWPLITGLAGCSLFYVLLVQGSIGSETLLRYFSAHPVSYFVTAMFFVGLAALTFKVADIFRQFGTLGRITLGIDPDQDLTVDDLTAVVEQLAQWPRSWSDSYLGRRFLQAIEFVIRKGSASGLDDELKYLADVDGVKQHESYSLVRIIIWATPMLGFLGTVIGITHALGDLGSQSDLLATDPKTAMQALLSGLYVAFDTTALALSLSIVLMFLQFVVDRTESQLLATVDRQVAAELTGRIVEDETDLEPHLVAVQRMGEAVLDSTEQLVRDQTSYWQQAIDGANDQWSQLLRNSGDQVRHALSESLRETVDRLADRLAAAEQQTDEQLRARWDQWQTALSDNARQLHQQQAEMVRQGEIMTRVLEATGDVVKLEEALNRNLQALAGAGNFEETVMSLSAAIHLLNARLNSTTAAPTVDLTSEGSQGRAA